MWGRAFGPAAGLLPGAPRGPERIRKPESAAAAQKGRLTGEVWFTAVLPRRVPPVRRKPRHES